MPPIYMVLVAAVVLAALLFGARAWKKHRWRVLRSRPLPLHWARMLDRNIPIHRKLPADLRKKLHGMMQVFLHEKHFEGCGGLTLNDEKRVTVAGFACLLVLNLNEKTATYPRLSSILIYPSAFIAPEVMGRDGTVREDDVRLGESWETGAVILAWDEVVRALRRPFDGENIVYHEFAHQLDREDGFFDGIPDLDRRSRYLSWVTVLGREFKRHKQQVSRGRRTVIGEYGAQDASEFFAVSTETFFEKPLPLKVRHPELYRELQGYYRLDPATWF